MYQLLSLAITILLLPIIVPLGIYIGIKYHWTDTVPRDEGQRYKPDPDRRKKNVFPCDPAVTDSIIRALYSLEAGINQAPEVDEEDETFLRHLDFEGATIRIRTQEMCSEGLSPEFIIETPSTIYEDFEEGPFDSAESELDHYLSGAKAIAAALVDEGLERITNVAINDKNYPL